MNNHLDSRNKKFLLMHHPNQLPSDVLSRIRKDSNIEETCFLLSEDQLNKNLRGDSNKDHIINWANELEASCERANILILKGEYENVTSMIQNHF